MEHDNEYFKNIEEQLISHEITPKGRLQLQISLASDLFLVLGQEEKFKDETDTEYNNRIMFLWTDGGDESYSKYFHDIEKSNEFKFHPRLQGDMYKITPADMLYYKEYKELPEA